jgi:hypothetical protein
MQGLVNDMAGMEQPNEGMEPPTEAGMDPSESAEVRPEGKQLSKNPEYDKLVGINPGFAPVAADTEPDETELMHFKEIYADFIDKLYDTSEKPAVKLLTSSQNLYEGVAKVAFHVLLATKSEYEQKEGKLDPSVFFGEGGMISTAVDEVFRLAQANRIPGTEDQDQYSASQFEVMRLIGEYIQSGQDDDAVSESQDLLLDIDEAAGGGRHAEPLDSDENDTLALGAAPPPGPEQAPEGGVPPTAAPPEAIPAEQGGLVPGGPPPGAAPPPQQPPQGLI